MGAAAFGALAMRLVQANASCPGHPDAVGKIMSWGSTGVMEAGAGAL